MPSPEQNTVAYVRGWEDARAVYAKDAATMLEALRFAAQVLGSVEFEVEDEEGRQAVHELALTARAAIAKAEGNRADGKDIQDHDNCDRHPCDDCAEKAIARAEYEADAREGR